mmetsp:Transcript_40639/g.79493  ORF Transcript_40639/g.79493 Transcript_40639/m.79493 type:complete len:267 (+) Transcript_40639:393-1193(+)
MSASGGTSSRPSNSALRGTPRSASVNDPGTSPPSASISSTFARLRCLLTAQCTCRSQYRRIGEDHCTYASRPMPAWGPGSVPTDAGSLNLRAYQVAQRPDPPASVFSSIFRYSDSNSLARWSGAGCRRYGSANPPTFPPHLPSASPASIIASVTRSADGETGSVSATRAGLRLPFPGTGATAAVSFAPALCDTSSLMRTSIRSPSPAARDFLTDGTPRGTGGYGAASALPRAILCALLRCAACRSAPSCHSSAYADPSANISSAST